jgi:hypothetical protein
MISFPWISSSIHSRQELCNESRLRPHPPSANGSVPGRLLAVAFNPHGAQRGWCARIKDGVEDRNWPLPSGLEPKTPNGATGLGTRLSRSPTSILRLRRKGDFFDGCFDRVEVPDRDVSVVARNGEAFAVGTPGEPPDDAGLLG